jgi:hypothetical protein
VRRHSARLALLGLGALVALPASAQPEPSVRASCGDLREALAGLPPPSGEAYMTIQVEGEVSAATSGEALVFMVICRPPDPQVACITYTTEGRGPGDRIVVAGAYTPGDPNRIVLDPCIHFAAEPTK